MTVKARITCEKRPGLLPPLSTYAFNCRRAQLRTEEGEGLVSVGFEAMCTVLYCVERRATDLCRVNHQLSATMYNRTLAYEVCKTHVDDTSTIM